MSEEHPIDGSRFRVVLLEQRAMRLKGGLYHLNQIQMAYNTNRIEGSRLSEEQTRYIYETRTVDGVAQVDDVVETSNSFRLFDTMLDAVGTPLTAERIREYHRAGVPPRHVPVVPGQVLRALQPVRATDTGLNGARKDAKGPGSLWIRGPSQVRPVQPLTTLTSIFADTSGCRRTDTV